MKNARKQQEREARKKDILETALKLFAQNDYHEVTVDKIADAVGLSKGTLYLYFENKENLFTSIVISKTNELYEAVASAINGPEPYMERLHNYCDQFLRFFEAHKPFFKIIHTEKSRGYLESRDKFHTLMMDSYKRFDHLLQNFIQEGQDKGELRQVSAGLMVKVLRGALMQVIFTAIFSGNGDNLTQYVPDVLDIFLNGAKA